MFALLSHSAAIYNKPLHTIFQASLQVVLVQDFHKKITKGINKDSSKHRHRNNNAQSQMFRLLHTFSPKPNNSNRLNTGRKTNWRMSISRVSLARNSIVMERKNCSCKIDAFQQNNKLKQNISFVRNGQWTACL